MMKTTLKTILIGGLFMLSFAASASLNQFKGLWKNVDPNTRGVTKMRIKIDSHGDIDLQLFGKCHPTDCDWGVVEGTAYAGSVTENLKHKARAITGVYEKHFKTALVVIKRGARGTLKAEIFNKFTDGSGRTNYVESHTFKKKLIIAPRKMPDLIVQTIHQPEWDHPNHRSVIKVTVKNIGNKKAAASMVRITDPSTSQSTGAPYNAVRHVPALNPGQSFDAILYLPYWIFNPDASIEAEADYKKQVQEKNENNNKKSFFVIG